MNKYTVFLKNGKEIDVKANEMTSSEAGRHIDFLDQKSNIRHLFNIDDVSYIIGASSEVVTDQPEQT